jgi:hypothetical protein
MTAHPEIKVNYGVADNYHALGWRLFTQKRRDAPVALSGPFE